MPDETEHNILLGRYRLVEELGQGSYGTVYRAVDTRLKIERAVKLLKPELTSSTEMIQRFGREALLAARLDHPNIAPVIDFEQDGGRYYLVMKLLTGGSLRDRLNQEGPLLYPRMLEILRQVAAGLDYAHRRQIIHRDLKPGNILFDDEERAYIADFGFARLLGDASGGSSLLESSLLSSDMSGGSKSVSLVGTMAYMAPELMDGVPASPASDQYSLACVVYEMLTGQVLFQGNTPLQVMKKHVDGPRLDRPWPTPVPTGFEPLLLKALSPDPRDRFSSATAFTNAVEAAGGAAVKNQPEADLAFEVDEQPAADEPVAGEPPEVEDPAANAPAMVKEVHKEALNPPLEPGPRKKGLVPMLIAVALILLLIGGGAWALNRPGGITPTPDPRQPTATQMTVAKATATTPPIKAEQPTPASQAEAAQAPTGQIAYTALDGNRTPQIFLINVDGSGRKKLTSSGSNRFPSWSPDGAFLLFNKTVEDKTEAFRIGADGSDERPLSNHSESVYDPVLSPDGKQVAYTFAVMGKTQIFVMKIDGTNIAQLTNDVANDFPVWSPDGQTLAFNSQGVRTRINVIGADGSARAQLGTKPGGQYSPAWSPDGQKIAYISTESSNPELMVMDANGANISRLTITGDLESSPGWSPDGQWIVFGLHNVANNTDWVAVIRADGTNLKLVTQVNMEDPAPRWRP